MKKLAILLNALIVTGITYGAQLELKAGFEPWREGKNSHADYDMGGSLGAEVLFNSINRPFDYGLGIEWKSDFKGDTDANNSLATTESSAIPVYLTGKYGIGEDLFYLVGRAGWTIYEDSDVNDGFYSAVGVGKEFDNLTVETLYEAMDIDGTSKLYSGEQAGLVSVKIGYRFGENTRDRIAREAEEAAKLEYERQQLEEANRQKALEEEKRAEEMAALEAIKTREEMLSKYEGYILADSYAANGFEPLNIHKEKVEEMKSDLKNEKGVMEIVGYTDDSGSESYNKKISTKRAEEAAAKISEYVDNENIEIVTRGAGEVNFLTDNSTKEKKALNRRVEVNFTPEDKIER